MTGLFRLSLVVASPVACLLLTACGSNERMTAPEIAVEGAWVRAVVVAVSESTDHASRDTTAGETVPPPSGLVNTAAYMTIRNSGRAADRLVGARSEVARMVEVHQTTIDSAGLARMRLVEAIEIEPGGEVRLEPGSYHLMLMGVRRTLPEGDTVRLLLEFENTGTVEVAAEVRPF